MAYSPLDWIIPSPYVRMLRTVRYSLFPTLATPNRALKNRHKGTKRCFVIGNGPSLKELDLTKLRNEICIAANSFFFHPDCATIAPAYWCVADPNYAAEKPNAIAWLRELESRSGQATLFFNPSAQPVLRKYGLFERRKVHFIYSGLENDLSNEVCLDLSGKVTVGRCTVSAFSIPLALYLGFEEIYLIGCDANWHLSDNNHSLHFYQTNPYFKHWDTNNGTREELKLSNEDELTSIAEAFKSHRLIRNWASDRGIKIYNATPGGQLDVYSRVEYHSLFA